MITEDLTLEQRFEYQRMIEASKTMNKQQALDLLIQAKRLLMIKSNVLADLSKTKF